MMQRIDTFLVEHGLAESREQAKRLILAGAVTVNGNSRIKPGQRIPADAEVVVQEQQKYVSRGGFKLEKALSIFEIGVQNRVALDVGASTGGFTDCLLQHGAKFVYAVDVGYGQLAWKLRTHPQVQSIEKTNIRHLTPTLLSRGEGTLKKSAETPKQRPSSKNLLHDSENFISIAVVDVSFISLRTVLPSVIKILTQENSCQSSVVSRQLKGRPCQNDNLLTENRKVFRRKTELTTDNHSYDIIALLKPQFEAGKEHVQKGGVVPDKRVHIQTIDNLRTFVAAKLGATVRGLTYSPIHKDIGNIEYLLWITIDLDTQTGEFRDYRQPKQTTAEVVAEAHKFFRSRQPSAH
ncbi:TlyA family rRNA (cytidine-2'-O)-methyltransferase [Candidatus Poribacteria bacterium]|nr:MAG: TlyA family rRNA (cytidine-2'-O)-methyltransferase [Candidatus Poribacteria bacterium]